MAENNSRPNSTRSISERASRRSFIRSVGTAGAAAALAGCSSSEQSSTTTTTESKSRSKGKTTVVFNTSLKGQAWQKYKEALHASGLPESIQLENTPLPEEGRNQTWEQWLSTNRTKPDLFMVDPTGRPFIQRDYLANLNEHMDSSKVSVVKEQMPDTMVSMYTANEQLYAVPFLLDIALVQYRKDLVEKAGYNTKGWQTNPLSWKNFSNVMADTTAQTDVSYGYGWPTKKNMLSNATFFEYMRSWGGSYFGGVPSDEKIGDRPITVDEQPVVDALRMARSFIYGENDNQALSGYGNCSPEAVLQWGDDPPVKHVEGGDMVGMRNWTWSIATLGAEDAYGKDLGVMPLPYGVKPSDAKYEGAGGSQTVMSGWYVAINANSDNPDAAAKVLDAMVTDRAQIALFRHQGYAPTKPELYSSNEIQEMPVIGRYADALGYAANHTGGMPELNPLWDRESKFFDQALMRSLKQQATPEEALSSLSTKIEDFESSRSG